MERNHEPTSGLKLGNYLKSLRINAGMTRKTVCDFVGRSKTWLRQYEIGAVVRMPSPEDMLALSKALKVTVAELCVAAGYTSENTRASEIDIHDGCYDSNGNLKPIDSIIVFFEDNGILFEPYYSHNKCIFTWKSLKWMGREDRKRVNNIIQAVKQPISTYLYKERENFKLFYKKYNTRPVIEGNYRTEVIESINPKILSKYKLALQVLNKEHEVENVETFLSFLLDKNVEQMLGLAKIIVTSMNNIDSTSKKILEAVKFLNASITGEEGSK